VRFTPLDLRSSIEDPKGQTLFSNVQAAMRERFEEPGMSVPLLPLGVNSRMIGIIMGTEIFPHILFFAKCIVGTIGVISVITIIVASIEYYIHQYDKKRAEDMKEQIVTGLMGITIALIAYFVLSGIGPVFRAIFTAY
jgi:hypothetical protein